MKSRSVLDVYKRQDEEHYAALEQLAGDLNIEAVIADPSAASFLECIRRHEMCIRDRSITSSKKRLRQTRKSLKA